jgi:hypothetical protein
MIISKERKVSKMKMMIWTNFIEIWEFQDHKSEYDLTV